MAARLSLAACIALASAAAAPAAQEARADLFPIRGIYIMRDECTDPVLALLRSLGLDTVFCVYNGYEVGELAPAIAAARRHDMRLVWAMFFHGGPEIERGFRDNPRRFVREDGTVTARTTCPLDAIYWERAAGERAMMLAHVARDDPAVAGIAYDVEMYAGASDYGWDQYCVCDACFDGFAQARGLGASAAQVAPARRAAWLRDRRLWPAFQRRAHDGVRRICRDIRERAQSIAPRFLFAVLPYGDLYSDDMADGFGTPVVPAVTMTEHTYSAGYRTDVEAHEAALRRRGVPARLLVGLWAYRRPPQDWSTLAYLCATRVGGYWLYNEFPWEKVFVASTPEERERYDLEGTPQEWQAAIARSNRETDRKLADPRHSPDLPLLELRRPDYAIDFAALGRPRASPGVVAAALPFTGVGLFWAGQYADIAATRIGDEATFTLPEGYAGPHRVRVRLLRGPDRGIVQVMVDGRPVGKPVDCYAPFPAPGGDEPRAPVRVGDDRPSVTLRVVGKNPAASGCSIGADCLYLDYAGPFCRDWLVIGPFANADHVGFDAVYPPERELRPGARYAGLDGETARWQTASANDSGLVDFLAVYGKQGRRDWAVAYALTHIYSPRERTARMLLGSDDGVKVWVNGQAVWSKLVRRGHDADKDRFPVRLRRGWNRLLVKVEQGTGAWGLRVRVTDPGGSLRYAAQPHE